MMKETPSVTHPDSQPSIRDIFSLEGLPYHKHLPNQFFPGKSYVVEIQKCVISIKRSGLQRNEENCSFEKN